MRYSLTINQNGQITIPAILRKTFFKDGKVSLFFREKEEEVVLKKEKTFKEILSEIDARREKAERENPELKKLRKENVGKTVNEMIDEYCESEEGKKWLEEEYGV